MIEFKDSGKFAKEMDLKDPLRHFRKEFSIPAFKGKPVIYFTGNSLGLQPKPVRTIIAEELDDWATLGVEGHFHSRRPWVNYHKFSKRTLALLAGAKVNEVVAMNQLTINLHLMMATFYRPTATRFKIITEAGAFSSDQYAIASQLRWHGLDPDKSLIELEPRAGEDALRTADIVSAIDNHAEELALVLMGGVQYYTGQFFNVREITDATHRVGAVAGFDLAHAIGNVPLSLHKHEVDFAVWCSYKYLNSGPGAIAGAFIHQKHGSNPDLLRLAGWWGHDEKERFQMKKGFRPIAGVDGWQVSNVPIFQAAAHLASLEVFQRAGMAALRKKSILLTGYLAYLLQQIDPHQQFYKILTPNRTNERGCQLSIFFFKHGRRIANALTKKGVSTDWREPNVIRVAPVPLYNTFNEVFRFADILRVEISKLRSMANE